MLNPTIILWAGRKLDKEVFIKSKKNDTPVFVQYNVTLRETMSSDLARAKEMLDSFTEIGEPARSTLLFCFNGYDNDTRALAEIHEVRAFVRSVLKLYPHLFYFLIPELNQHVFVCTVPYTMIKSPLIPPLRIASGIPPTEHSFIQFDVPAADRQITKMTEAVLQYGVGIGDESGARNIMDKWRASLNL